MQHGTGCPHSFVAAPLSFQVVSSMRFDQPILKAAFSPVDSNQLAAVGAASGSLLRIDADTGALRSIQVASVVREGYAMF